MSSNESSLSFADHENTNGESINTREPPNEKSSTSSFFTPRYIVLIIVGFAYVLSFFVNLKVVRFVCIDLCKRIKQARFLVSALVAHLSLICIVIMTISVLDICQSENLLKSLEPPVSQVEDVFKDSTLCAFALTTLLIVNERVRKISDFNESLQVYRILGWLWAFSSGQAIISKALWYLKKLELANFKLVAKIVGISYEIVRFLICHLLVGITISYALFKVHCKLGQLERPCERLKSKMENMHCFYILFGSFAIAWIAYGFGSAAIRVAFFLEYDFEPRSTLIEYFRLGFHAYLVLHPLVHMVLLHGKIDYLCGKGSLTRYGHFDEESATGLIDDDENGITVNLTNPVVMEQQRRHVNLNVPCPFIREMSASPTNFGRRLSDSLEQRSAQTKQDDYYWDFEYIDAESDNESVSDGEMYNIPDQRKKVSYTGTEITYFEEDFSDDGKLKASATQGEFGLYNFKGKETVI